MLAKDAFAILAMLVAVVLIIASFVLGLGFHDWFWAADLAWIGYPIASWAEPRIDKILER